MEIKYRREELEEALEIVSSVINRCEKIQPKFDEGTSQNTLLKNRIKAMYISKAVITKDAEIERYSKEELINALNPVASVKSKCETGQRKHESKNPQYVRFQKIIDAMSLAKSQIEGEISKRG